MSEKDMRTDCGHRIFNFFAENFFDLSRPGRSQIGKIKNPAVQQMGRTDIGKRPDHRILAARHAPFDILQHRLHRIALQSVLTAAKVAGNDRKRHVTGKRCKVCFGSKGKRP